MHKKAADHKQLPATQSIRNRYETRELQRQLKLSEINRLAAPFPVAEASRLLSFGPANLPCTHTSGVQCKQYRLTQCQNGQASKTHLQHRSRHAPSNRVGGLKPRRQVTGGMDKEQLPGWWRARACSCSAGQLTSLWVDIAAALIVPSFCFVVRPLLLLLR